MWGGEAPRRIFAYTQPTDMRKSFQGLLALVQRVFTENPYSGSLFVFVNRRGNYVKILAASFPTAASPTGSGIPGETEPPTSPSPSSSS